MIRYLSFDDHDSAVDHDLPESGKRENRVSEVVVDPQEEHDVEVLNPDLPDFIDRHVGRILDLGGKNAVSETEACFPASADLRDDVRGMDKSCPRRSASNEKRPSRQPMSRTRFPTKSI